MVKANLPSSQTGGPASMRWVDAGHGTRAVLVLSHGVSEHILRYEPWRPT